MCDALSAYLLTYSPFRDYDAQIQRCDERIAEGIMPLNFHKKREQFVRLKFERA